MRTKIDNDEGFFRLIVVLMRDALKIINLAIADTFTTTRLNNFPLGYFPIYLIYKPCKFVFFVLSVVFYQDYNTSMRKQPRIHLFQLRLLP